VISGSDERDLLTALHGGGEEDPLWATFLVRLRRRFRADSARLLLAGGGATAASQVLSEPEASQPRRGPVAGDGLAEAILAAPMRSQRVYGLRELAQNDGFARLARPVPTGLALRLVHESLSAWLILTRAEPFAAGESALVAALVPHLAIALANHAVRERARTREHLLGAVLDRLHYGWVTLGAEGRIVDSDPRATALIREGALLGTGPSGELLTVSASANRLIAETLDQVRRGERVQCPAVRSSDSPRLDLLLKPLPAGGSAEALLVAYLQEEGSETGDASGTLGALYGLAPREARLAMALAEGDGIPEAAERLGLSVETARNYSKSLYAKLGARGQAQLARIVALSLAGLA
jgi:DNA-binding CsgD family transcriptional regulator